MFEKKKSGRSDALRVFAMLVAVLATMAGCAEPGEPEGPNVSDVPSVAITYLMSNFDDETTPHQIREKSTGYFFTFDDPSSEADTKPELEFLSTGKFPYYGMTNSLRIRGNSAGAGVGLGTYFENGKTRVKEVCDADYNCTEAIIEKNPRPFSEHGQEGLVFWAKGKGTLKISLNMPAVVAEKLGGDCIEASEKCFDYHAVGVTVDGKWREYTVSWDKFKQVGWGKSVKFDPDVFTSIQFTVEAKDGVDKNPFDIWFNMIGFYGGDVWPGDWMPVLDADGKPGANGDTDAATP